jgi:ADP-heptose:LPS heptosyltransferase
MSVRVPPAAGRAAGSALASAGVPAATPYAVLLPGASCSSRRWPAPRFADAAGRLAAAGLIPVAVGTERERELVATASAVPDAYGLVDAVDVPGLAALLAGAAVAVTNNSGGMHLAAAVGTPVVCAFAGTELEEQYRPRDVPAVLLRRPTPCAPCRQLTCPYGQECLEVTPEEVTVAALALASRSVGVG